MAYKEIPIHYLSANPDDWDDKTFEGGLTLLGFAGI